MRLFISLPLEPTLARQISKKFSELDLPWDTIKKTRVDQIHVTLKFLGEMPLEDLPKIIEVLNNIKAGFDTLELEIDKPEIFTPTNPRTLTLSLKQNSSLQHLYNQIDQALFDAGLTYRDTRRFIAHLTLGRVKKFDAKADWSKYMNWQIAGNFSNSYFELQESILEKTGPTYNILQTFDLS